MSKNNYGTMSIPAPAKDELREIEARQELERKAHVRAAYITAAGLVAFVLLLGLVGGHQ